MKMIKPDDKLSKEHIEKAKHNLKAADYSVQGNFNDWAVSQSYYAMYHALLEIIFHMEDLYFIRTTEQMTTKDAKSLREEFQYGTKTDVNKVLLTELLQKSKDIVEKVEIMMSEI